MPRIRTQVDMKREEEGGRHAPFWENYRPHLIPLGTEDYLGVTVVGLSEDQAIAPGDSAEVDFDLVYHPKVDYGGLVDGTQFEIREGARGSGVRRECHGFKQVYRGQILEEMGPVALHRSLWSHMWPRDDEFRPPLEFDENIEEV